MDQQSGGGGGVPGGFLGATVTNPQPLPNTGGGGAGMLVEAAIPPTIAQSELNRLVKQLYHLREALRPFAHFAAALPPTQPDPNEPARLTDVGPAIAAKNPRNPMGEEHVVTFADFRHAKMLVDQLDSDDFKRFMMKTERKMMGIPDLCTALNCQQQIMGVDECHLAGFCSTECHGRTLRSPYARY